MEITKEDKMLLAGAEDKYKQCLDQYRLTYTNFLDIRQRSLVESMVNGIPGSGKDVRCVFYGGYEDAERTIAVFLPDYADESECPISVVRAKAPANGRKLTHRDYLGALMGLGLKREMVGDILTNERGADIIVMDDIKDFILLNYSKAGRVSLQLDEASISELIIPERKTVTTRDTVASLRLDNVVSSAFKLSRAKAAEAIRAGLVFLNSIEAEKTDMQVKEGDKLVLRGKGKAILTEVGGKTRKDRIPVVIERYM